MFYVGFYWFTLILLSYMGFELATHPPKDEKDKTRWRRRFIVVGLLGIGVSADVAYQQSKEADEIIKVGQGAKGPDISVELHYGPTNGMARQADVADNPAPLVLLITNRSDRPIYDLSLLMWAGSPAFQTAAGKFDAGGLGTTNFVPAHYGAAIALPADYLTNEAHFQFTSTTRAGRLDYDFNFLQVSNRWEHSNTVIDGTARRLILTDVSPGFGRP